jgi:hypothetical protein
LILFFLHFAVWSASARTLRCGNVPSASAKINFEALNFEEGSSLFLSVTRAGALDFGEEVELDYGNTNRNGYARYSGKTSNSNLPLASLWLNPSYINERGYFPGELTLRSASSTQPIPLLCTLTQR